MPTGAVSILNAAEIAEPHNADRYVAGRPLWRLVPDLLRLLRAIEHALAVMVEHPPDDIFGHVLGQIVGNHLDDRHVGQAGIGEDVVDTGADREDRAQVGQRLQEVRLLLPHHRIGDRRVRSAVRLQHHFAFRRQQLAPALRMKAGDGKQDFAFFHLRIFLPC